MVLIFLSWHLPEYISHFGHKLWSNTLDKLKPIVKYNTTKKYTSFNKNLKNAKKINSKQKLITCFCFCFLVFLKNLTSKTTYFGMLLPFSKANRTPWWFPWQLHNCYIFSIITFGFLTFFTVTWTTWHIFTVWDIFSILLICKIVWK